MIEVDRPGPMTPRELRHYLQMLVQFYQTFEMKSLQELGAFLKSIKQNNEKPL